MTYYKLAPPLKNPNSVHTELVDNPSSRRFPTSARSGASAKVAGASPQSLSSPEGSQEDALVGAYLKHCFDRICLHLGEKITGKDRVREKKQGERVSEKSKVCVATGFTTRAAFLQSASTLKTEDHKLLQ